MKRISVLLLCLVSLFAHGQVTIKNLPASSAVAGTDLTIDDQSGTTRTATFSQVGTYIYANLPLLVVAGGGTGITSGTSGGIPYFSSTSTIASTALLTANALLLGGGAGGTPTNVGSLGTTTTVLHGNAAGAPTFGAVALGTDVSGTLAAAQEPAHTGDCTNSAGSLALTCTSTNGTGFGTFATANAATPPSIGSTTPAAGAFTTLSASSTVSGTGFSTYLASPPAIGGSAAAAGTFTALTSTTSAANLASNLTQAANTSADGVMLIDSTAATVGAQQYSPRIRLTGQGWATTPVASRTIDWIIEAQPIQGTTNPSTNLAFSYQINGGGYTAGPIIGTTNITTGGGGTGTMNGSVNVGNAAITGNGIYHFATNALGFSTNATAAGDIDATQHWRVGGAGAATIASGACGATTNGTIAGNDHAGLITIGSASTATCAITFSAAYTTAPRAVNIQSANAAAASALTGEYISALSTGGFTITGTLASTTWYYWVQ